MSAQRQRNNAAVLPVHCSLEWERDWRLDAIVRVITPPPHFKPAPSPVNTHKAHPAALPFCFRAILLATRRLGRSSFFICMQNSNISIKMQFLLLNISQPTLQIHIFAGFYYYISFFRFVFCCYFLALLLLLFFFICPAVLLFV